jgi:transcriptional regulator with XRE-family HTH domain
MNVQRLGSYIRGQRERSRLSLSKVSGLAGVSIPYLSQIERGLRKPSAEILQAIAKALSISAETLYIQAEILEARPAADVTAAIMADPAITPRQKQALVQIYEAFRADAGAPEATAALAQVRPAAPARSRRASSATPGLSIPVKPGGRAKTPAVRGPHPAPLRPPATNS